jgi:hypothetical protein
MSDIELPTIHVDYANDGPPPWGKQLTFEDTNGQPILSYRTPACQPGAPAVREAAHPGTVSGRLGAHPRGDVVR